MASRALLPERATGNAFTARNSARGTVDGASMTLRLLEPIGPTLDERREALLDKAIDGLTRRARLRPRELSIARLLARGKSGREIQEELGIARDTYKLYARGLYTKTGTDNAEHWRARVYTTVIDTLLGRSRP